ncbi:MAG: M48 family metalloprotease [Rickettsiales bacterium]|nr:M48 family metalloprotease [Rickettsiales bacterium]
MLKKIAIILLLFFSFFSEADAENGLIRDAESEKFLRNLAKPIFKAANLNADNIKIYIINDNSINAFVSGGQNVFINTGLIRKYNTPDALIGVIAHETGHIAAGHLARSGEAMEKSSGAMLLSYLLGIGAVIGGSPEAGQAIILGGSQTAERLYMKFTRGQEEAADQHAIEYLAKMQYPASGLVSLLEFFEREMIGYKGQIDEYLLSHPVSEKRIALIKERTKNTNFSDQKINAKLQEQMNVVLAKLEGFMDEPDAVLETYNNQNDRLSNYKKSIALFRKGKAQQSLKLLDNIINETSANNKSEIGFLYELRGQVLFELGQVDDSIISYNKAIKLLDERDSSQVKIAFAMAVLSVSKNDHDLANLVIKRLLEAKKYEYDNPFLFKQIASAYNKIGDKGRSFLALAEFNFWRGDNEKAIKYAKEAKKNLDKNDKEELLRADDLTEIAKKSKSDD